MKSLCCRGVFAALACVSLVTIGAAQEKAAPAGQSVMVCGHSFHAFIGRGLDPLATAAGIRGHKTLGIQFLGGSSVTQHWELPDTRDTVKKTLSAGGVDVLTLSPNWIMPDPAIERFVDLAVKSNSKVRVLVQMSWPAYDGMQPPHRIANLAERDKKTPELLRAAMKEWNAVLEKQVRDANARYPRPVVFLVPVGEAVTLLRDKIVRGEAPGLKRQSELFTDLLGHGTEPLQRLVTYCHYSAIYRQSPAGLAVFEKMGDDASRRQNRFLQELAWQAVKSHPLSGVPR